MSKQKQIRRNAFTLIEILLVVSIAAILVGVGLPSLGKALGVYRFKNNSNQVQAMLYAVRHAAISGESADNSQDVDTNFDGTLGDLTPFAYVFEIVHGAASQPMTLRTYADFNLDEQDYDSATDELLEQKTFNSSQLQVSYTGYYIFGNESSVIDANKYGKIYSFSYSIEDGSLTMWETDMSAQNSEEIELIMITADNPDAVRPLIVNLFHLAGAPFISK